MQCVSDRAAEQYSGAHDDDGHADCDSDCCRQLCGYFGRGHISRDRRSACQLLRRRRDGRMYEPGVCSATGSTVPRHMQCVSDRAAEQYSSAVVNHGADDDWGYCNRQLHREL